MIDGNKLWDSSITNDMVELNYDNRKQLMAPANVVLYHHFNAVGRGNLVKTHLDFLSHFHAVSLPRLVSSCAHFLYFAVFINDLHNGSCEKYLPYR